jgi:hypothetical protein
MKRENSFLQPTTKNLMVYKVNQAITMLLRFIFNEKKKKQTKKSFKKQARLTAQLRKAGRLGFSKLFIDDFEISSSKGLAIAVDAVQSDNNVFYGVITPAGATGSTRFVKSGSGYFAIKTPDTFSQLGYNFENENYIFEIEKVDYNGNEVLKFTRRNPIGEE